VIVFGTARILESEQEIYQAVKLLGLKYNDDLAAVEAEIVREWDGLSCVEISIAHMTGKEGLELLRARTE
jgi:hypothetical protein